jgi:hypothetical protein
VPNETKDTMSILRFGIPSLDALFGTSSISQHADGILISHSNEQTKVSVVGPAGSGKSLVALHAASRYTADLYRGLYPAQTAERPRIPKVIYLSTDLTYVKADQVWSAFRLDLPNLREIPFYVSAGSEEQPWGVPAHLVPLHVNLRPLDPFDQTDIARFFLGSSSADGSTEAEVGFVDFINHPVGDAWAFTNRLISALEETGSVHQHLVIIDNIDGFEVVMGDVNEFGEQSSVRARITRAIQAAASRAHIVFVAEEGGMGARHLSDISDVQVELRIQRDRDYQFRTIAVAKARAQAVNRGEHYLLIRTGAGSTTGPQENADDPRTTNAYLHVIPSLHTSSRRLMNEPEEYEQTSEPETLRRMGFGLPYLDELCGSESPTNPAALSLSGLVRDVAGIRPGSLYGIVGDSNTYKTHLGERFIRRSFELFADNLADLLDDWREQRHISKSPRIRSLVMAIDTAKPETGSYPIKDTHKEIETYFNVLADQRSKAEFLAKTLLSRQTGSEAVWSHSQVVEDLLACEDGVTPRRLVFLWAEWLTHLRTSKLRSMLNSPLGEVLATIEPFLPKEIQDHDLLKALKEGEVVSGEQLLAAALRERWRETDGKGTILFAEEIQRDYLEHRIGKFELVKKVRAHFTNPSSSPNEKSKDQELQSTVATRWRQENAYDFLRTKFRGSTDYLTIQEQQELQADSIVAHNNGAGFKDDLIVRGLIGMAAHRIAASLECVRTEQTSTLENGMSLNGLSPDKIFGEILRNDELYSQRPGDVFPSPGRVAAGDPRVLDWAQVRRVIPEIQDSSESTATSSDADSTRAFSQWLLDLSPSTHPFAREGLMALTAEIQGAFSDAEVSRTIRFTLAALVSALLQLVCRGKLKYEHGYSVDAEVRARRDATTSAAAFSAWASKYLAPTPACDRFRELAEKIEKRNLDEAALNAFRGVIDELTETRLSRAELEPPNASIPDASVMLRFCAILLRSAARKGLADGPAVLVTTNDTKVEKFAARHSQYVEKLCEARRYDAKTAGVFRAVCLDHLRQWLVVRRLEVHYIATPTLAAIVRRSVEVAQRLLLPQPVDRINSRRRRTVSWNIRVIIDGLAALRRTYPNAMQDALFLPSLRLYIEREKLTALIIASQSGRPTAAGENDLERETLDFFLNQIRTWRVQFFGEHRTAVTVLPPAPEYGSARVREILLRPDGELSVNPHFELYSGLESGAAHPVPLQIRLVGEGKAVTPYKEALNSVLTDIFPAISGSIEKGTPVVILYDSDSPWTEQLRDFGRLHRESYLNYTLIVQLDEYWAFQRSDALRRQTNYLLAPCQDSSSHQSDPFGVFQLTTADRSAGGILRRVQQFSWNGYVRTGKQDQERLTSAERGAMDRVPFMWDFGFLLCHRTAWEAASKSPLHTAVENYRGPEGEQANITVGEVWNSLGRIESAWARPNIPSRVGAGSLTPRTPLWSWRFTLEAASVVQAYFAMSTRNQAPSFDLPVKGGESLCVLVLEMWASEVYQKFRSDSVSQDLLPIFFRRFVKRSWAPSHTRGLVGLLAEPSESSSLARLFARALAKGQLPTLHRHSMELFKSILLLREVLDLSSLFSPEKPFQLRPREVNANSVCARHWYSTAATFFSANEGADAFVPVRLPGHFSVRGDWYLGVARGSRSGLVADRALDLLSSRRGNLERLQAGLGLPVREAGDVNGLNPRTRIPIVGTDGRRDWIRYQNFTALGADDPGASDDYAQGGLSSFNWLWRSTLGDYDAQARVFQKGIAWLFDWWASLRNVRGTQWKSGFHLYDALTRYYTRGTTDEEKRRIFDENFAVNSLWEFPEICDVIVDSLRRATPRRSR